MLFETVQWFAGVVILNFIIYRLPLDERHRWYAIHFIYNMFVVYICKGDLYELLIDPIHAFTDSTFTTRFPVASTSAICAVMALHLSHPLLFTINRTDILHHVVMCLLLLIPYYYQTLLVIGTTNSCLFFLSGLPGGIDYLMLVLTQWNIISKLGEKQWNTEINTWIRSPGILFCVFSLYLKYLYRTATPSNHIAIWISIIVLAWNGQYYAKLASISYGAHRDL